MSLPLSREQRLRRVIILCGHFAQNLAFFRAGWRDRRLIRDSVFWRIVNGNCLDIAILEWCKLFADAKGKHCWRKVVSDRTAFEDGLVQVVGPGIDLGGFEEFANTVRKYRDKFVAHLDDELRADIPYLEDCWTSVRFYHGYVVNHEASGVSFHGLPLDLAAFYETRFEVARTAYCS